MKIKTHPTAGGRRRTRREFLGLAVRLGLLGALAALGIALFGRSGRATAGTDRASSCVGNDYCRACVRRSGCGLPQALSYRRKFGG